MRTFGSLLVRGLIVGLFAGLLAGTFAYVTGEPHIDSAIAIEEAAVPRTPMTPNGKAIPADPEEEPLVSRDGQRFGLFLATSLYGVALGGIFAVGFTLLRRRLRTPSDSYAALGLAAAGYVGIVLVPFLKYPPNPPAVGDPETITKRTVTLSADARARPARGLGRRRRVPLVGVASGRAPWIRLGRWRPRPSS